MKTTTSLSSAKNKPHSILGASSAYRWLACPGSVRLSAGMPKSTSIYAAEGTAAHELAEMLLRDGRNAAEMIGAIIEVEGSAFTVTEEMAEAVQMYLDVVRGDLAAEGGGKNALRIEHPFKLDWLYEGMFGTNDSTIFGRNIIRVYDFKYGAGVVVDAEDNVQMMYYALGAIHDTSYKEVELVVVQPRATHSDGPCRRFRLSAASLSRWANEVLVPGARATENPDALLSFGEHCRFCPAIARCPLQKDRAYEVAKQAFSEVPVALPTPDTMLPTALKKILDATAMVETWFNACKLYARTLLETGRMTPEELGYKLVAGKINREWKDPKEAQEWLEMLLSEDAFVPKKLVSPAQAEKVLKGAANKKALETLVTKKPGDSQLVPVNDKREALQNAVTAFDEVEE